MELVRFQYQGGEYARGLRRHRVREFQVARDGVILGIVAAIAYFVRNEGFMFWLFVAGPAFYLLMVVLSIGVYPLLAPRFRPHLNDPYALAFSEAEIAFSTPTVESKLPWSVYKSWSQDDDYIYLSLGRGHATIIPRRAVEGAEREAALLSLFAERIGPERAAARGLPV